MLKLRQHFIPVVSEILVPCFEDRYFHSIRRVVEDKDAAFRQRFLGLPAKRRPFSSQQYFEGEKHGNCIWSCCEKGWYDVICEFWIGSNPIDGKQCPHMRGVTVITFVASTLVRHLNQFERVLPSKPHTQKKETTTSGFWKWIYFGFGKTPVSDPFSDAPAATASTSIHCIGHVRGLCAQGHAAKLCKCPAWLGAGDQLWPANFPCTSYPMTSSSCHWANNKHSKKSYPVYHLLQSLHVLHPSIPSHGRFEWHWVNLISSMIPSLPLSLYWPRLRDFNQSWQCYFQLTMIPAIPPV